MDKYHVYSGKVGSCVGSRGLLGRVEHVRVVQMSVILESKFSLSYEVHSVLTLLCVCVCVTKCVHPCLTDLISESGAALRINTDMLTALVHMHDTHTHTFFALSVSSVSCQFSPAPWVLFRARQMANTQNESRS